MKTLTNEDKLEIMNDIVEPLIKYLSPDVTASCIQSMLKEYLNSDAAINQEPEMRASTIFAAGIAIILFDDLRSRYED